MLLYCICCLQLEAIPYSFLEANENLTDILYSLFVIFYFHLFVKLHLFSFFINAVGFRSYYLLCQILLPL